MCGIVGVVARRNVQAILLRGLEKLEYRGYDSAGLAIITQQGIATRKFAGKLQTLTKSYTDQPEHGMLGIGHTRWATHGAATKVNAHPHATKNVAVVHNGVIENYAELKQQHDFSYVSQTDTELVLLMVDQQLCQGAEPLQAVQHVLSKLEGSYALVFVFAACQNYLIGARQGSPMVLGLGIDENYFASDVLALQGLTAEYIFLEEGDIVALSHNNHTIYQQGVTPVHRKTHIYALNETQNTKGDFSHFMEKEIHDQPKVIAATYQQYIAGVALIDGALPAGLIEQLKDIDSIHIVACGTSYHAGMVAKYWLEALAGIAVSVEVASEYRYRDPVVLANTIFLTLSQSGETADTLASLQLAQKKNYVTTVAMSNVASSALVRDSASALLTKAGTEVSVAATKAFTTQLTLLFILTLYIAKIRGLLTAKQEKNYIQILKKVPEDISTVLHKAADIAELAGAFVSKYNCLFLGRGSMYPIALEGALKLKEISYIHAEAFPAGELKHGPLALVGADTPIIVVAPSNHLYKKLQSNIEMVQARGGEMYVFADKSLKIPSGRNTQVIKIESADNVLSPILFTIPLQLLAYFVATHKGTDLDQPRNLAKSVTVE